ncbi:hypothetical protein BS50DRAFT_580116 [Corynespora cassiicola Philippines]|uniref:Uncharacterized protein n=1 Tax=Corynespora cassiicola Philippines TaxID=1448308 RepID=A0A2T2N1D5_CORCC|nr:hypothetical protein BS50DRAFT_580116 [Corynespora cassiicola Philippines]
MASSDQSRNHAEPSPSPPEVQAFRDSLHAISNEAEQFEACVAMRNQLFDQQSDLELHFARVEKVMLAECARYKEAKRGWSNKRDPDTNTKKWQRFVDIASMGASRKRECLAPLTKASLNPC